MAALEGAAAGDAAKQGRSSVGRCQPRRDLLHCCPSTPYTSAACHASLPTLSCSILRPMLRCSLPRSCSLQGGTHGGRRREIADGRRHVVHSAAPDRSVHMQSSIPRNRHHCRCMPQAGTRPCCKCRVAAPCTRLNRCRTAAYLSSTPATACRAVSQLSLKYTVSAVSGAGGAGGSGQVVCCQACSSSASSG